MTAPTETIGDATLYQRFLAAKTAVAPQRGLSASPQLAGHLFDYQRACVAFLLEIGSGGLFLDTGLGKTAVELEWCAHAAEASNGHALILTPLAVARQIEREAHRWGYDARVVRSPDDIRPGISICNYDRLPVFDPSAFGAIALDESSILKSFQGREAQRLIHAFSNHRFRLSATATPAPNDHMELGAHAEFCGVIAYLDMLARWFIHDSGDTQAWRLKRHAVEAFWSWMASWARMAERPSDLGGDDAGFALPPLNVHRHRTAAQPIVGTAGDLFGRVDVSATDMHAVKRQTAEARARVAADLVTAEPSEPWVLWCDTDYEADAIAAALRGMAAVAEIRGSHPAQRKEDTLAAFADGSVRYLITKPSVTGFGLNWQHCARAAFVGRSFSYESWYQAIRRFWRFGQQRAVECHIVVAEGEDAIGRVIDRKAGDHAAMKAQMVSAMARAIGQAATVKAPYSPTHIGRLPKWLKSVV